MTVNISDPLGLLAAQNGISDPLPEEAKAAAATSLTSSQVAASIGEPVPIVFCRQVSGSGGVFVSPRATEGRYENAASTNVLTVSLMLVLSEGNLPTLPIKDVFQGACRQGTWAQTYDRRAGTWTPGNAIGTTTLAGATIWNCPFYCGTSGRYDNMTTLSYINTFDDADTRWQRQVHVFVRNGMQVTRILDDTLGSSNNFIDLALYLIRQSNQISETLIDTTGMTAAANFTNTNNFFFNGEFSKSTNLESWLTTTGNYFLLRLVQSEGKYTFKPRVVVNADHTIKTDQVEYDYEFTEEHLLPDGFEIDYIPFADRQDIVYDMMWRQQPDADIGFARSTQVKYDGLADSGPYEQHDLSAFCCYEDHAVKVAAYKLAVRRYVTHTLRIKVRPGIHSSTLEVGDICRVYLRRETAVGNPDFHDYLYEIERIEKTTGGACIFTLTHFPIDDLGRSLVAREVERATGPGTNIDVGRSDYTCDENDDDDETSLASEGVDYPAFDAPSFAETATEIAASTDPDDTVNNPLARGVTGDLEGQEAERGGKKKIRIVRRLNDDDELETDLNRKILSFLVTPPNPGEKLTVSDDDFTCEGVVEWYRIHKDTGARELVGTSTKDSDTGNYELTLTTADMDHYIQAIGRCGDPSTASGFGPGQLLGETPVVPVNYKVYDTIIQTSGDSDDTSTIRTYQGPAEIRRHPTVCINCAGQTANCSDEGARPTYQVTNAWNPTAGGHPQCGSYESSRGGFSDLVRVDHCSLTQEQIDNAIELPFVQSYSLHTTLDCD